MLNGPAHPHLDCTFDTVLFSIDFNIVCCFQLKIHRALFLSQTVDVWLIRLLQLFR